LFFPAEFERSNAFFQATYVDPSELDKEVDMHHRSLRRRLFDRLGHEVSLDRVDFGAKFLAELNKYAKENGTADTLSKIISIKGRCYQFIMECMKQVKIRLPATKNIFKNAGFLSPHKVLSQTERLCFSKLPFAHLLHKEHDLMDRAVESEGFST